MRTLTASLLLLLLALPAFAQTAAMQPPVRPAELFLPPGIEPPDLTGYDIVDFHPDMDPLVALAAVSVKSRARGPVAWRFAPGNYSKIDVVHHEDGPDTTTSFWPNLWRNRNGTLDQPQYFGPLDPTAPLPVLPTYAFLSNSANLHIQGLIVQRLKFGHVPLHEPAQPVLVEGVWIDGGVFIQSAQEPDGTSRPARDITIRRSWLMGSGGQGAYGNRCENVRIVECVIDFAGSSGTKDHALYFADVKGFIVERCIISRASSSAAKWNEGTGIVMRDNLIVRCHNWITANSNPRATTPGSQGDGMLITGNIITSMGRKQDKKGGMGYFGWGFQNVTVRDNLFAHLQPDRPYAGIPVLILPPFYGPTLNAFAGALDGLTVEGNLMLGGGRLVHVKSQNGVLPDISDITVRGNTIAEIPSEDPQARSALFDGQVLDVADEFTVSGNTVPPWTPHADNPLGPISMTGGGQARRVTVRNPDATIHTWAATMGWTEDDAGLFTGLASGISPAILIDSALAYFRTEYEVVATENAPVPATLPWLDGTVTPDPEDEEDPEDPPVDPEEPVEDPEDPIDPNPSEIPNGWATHYRVLIDGWIRYVPVGDATPVRITEGE